MLPKSHLLLLIIILLVTGVPGVSVHPLLTIKDLSVVRYGTSKQTAGGMRGIWYRDFDLQLNFLVLENCGMI